MIPLDPRQHADWTLDDCGPCSRCCDGSLFTAGLTLLEEFAATARHFPIVFHRFGPEYLPGMFYTLEPGRPCPYLDDLARRCTIYDDGRPMACIHFPFRLFLKDRPQASPFPGFPAHLEMDGRCPGLGPGATGAPLVTENGEPAAIVRDLPLPTESGGLEKTREFCDRLAGLDLLVRKKRRRPDGKPGKKRKKTKYWVVDAARLAALERGERQRLARLDYLQPIQAHLESLRYFSLLETS